MIPRSLALAGLLGLAWFVGMAPFGAAAGLAAQAPPTLTADERARLIRDLSVLAHDSMEGRRAGTPGAERARRYLVAEFPARGLEPIAPASSTSGSGTPAPGGADPWTHPFGLGGGAEGRNVLGVIRGTERPGTFLVVTAHYDHLGIRNGQTYNGADDNASGTAGLLALASWFSREKPRHSIVFAAFDGEESGLIGARAFVQSPPIPLDSIFLNVNLDMVSRSDRRELFAVGPYHHPWLSGPVEEVAGRSGLSLLMGHDRPNLPPGDDWTDASDHGAFHAAKIPFVYFGVEDHADYHRPTDDFDAVPQDFFVEAVETVLDFLVTLDRRGPEPR